jgi:hypothetical protein
MKRVYWTIIAVIVLLGCKTVQKDNIEKLEELNTNTQSDNLPKEQEPLPSSLKIYIENNLKRFYIPSTDEYVDEWQDFTKKDQLPFLAYSDFNNDGSVDYAVVLRHKDDNKVTLFIFNTDEKGYSHFPLDFNYVKEGGIETIISIEKKGTWEAIDTAISVVSDGVMVQLITESIGHSYYWNGHKYIMFVYD